MANETDQELRRWNRAVRELEAAGYHRDRDVEDELPDLDQRDDEDHETEATLTFGFSMGFALLAGLHILRTLTNNHPPDAPQAQNGRFRLRQ